MFYLYSVYSVHIICMYDLVRTSRRVAIRTTALMGLVADGPLVLNTRHAQAVSLDATESRHNVHRCQSTNELPTYII
jgi:hypothetical protein